MGKLRLMLQRLTGKHIDHRDGPKYMAINLSYHHYVDAGRINDYILFDTPGDFRKWVSENVAKIDQGDWKLYSPVTAKEIKGDS